MSKLLIRNGRILDPGRDVDLTGDVFIVDGKIAAFGPDLAANGAEVIDATSLIVCPGFVDIHTHLRDPGQEYKESIQTGTQAAAHGGFTTVCCMPNTDPPIDTRATVEYVLRTASAADVALAKIEASSSRQQADLARAGFEAALVNLQTHLGLERSEPIALIGDLEASVLEIEDGAVLQGFLRIGVAPLAKT